ncbi:CHRD domain-containing protein [Streptomyces arenae]|uniref:CHRD domain-containing protein n=1 Tax=Streptomyces arenae TaxID=29301 RepID=UPI00265B048C|nr:CHRD domain-containing protein [Streptomyces arenae]MCG7202871.1 CHRD domain-containing protein [Streptomyces arenae]
MVVNATRRTSLVVAAVTVTALGAAVVPAAAATSHRSDRSTGSVVLAASLRGADEVPVAGKPAVGDKDGAALEFIQVKGDKVTVAVTWRGTGRPTDLHIHQGAKGTNGGVVIDFGKVLKKIKGHTATGSVKVTDQALLGRLTADPGAFYANLHTAEFPGGAVRGQLHAVTTVSDLKGGGFQASVVTGRQIYECKAAGNGGYAFAQRDVSAKLGGGIRHSFVAPNSGTPQWVAPDGSAVTGAVLSKTPNGTGNIPELDLRATPSGKKHGLLAHTGEILRLNTVGGVAPTGACTPGAVVGVPYRADYVFVQHR